MGLPRGSYEGSFAAVSPVLAHFIDEADLTTDDIRELQRILAEKRKKTSDERPRSRRGRSS